MGIKKLKNTFMGPKKGDKMGAFIQEFDSCGAVQSIACRMVGVDAQTVKAWRNTFPEFNLDYEKVAGKHGKEVMETIRLHGVTGQEQIDGTRKIDSRLTEMMAELHVPEVRELRHAKDFNNFNMMVLSMFESYTDAIKEILDSNIPEDCPKCRKSIGIKASIVQALGDVALTYRSREKIESEIKSYNEKEQTR